MEYLPVSEKSLAKAAAIIAAGGLVAFPTETVYGLGADAFNPRALARIFDAKGRPRFDPLIVHIADVRSLEKIADLSLLSPEGRNTLSVLASKLWPGPLTLVLPKQKTVPDIATSGLPSVAVRIPAHPAAQRLIELSGRAIAAPSANPFGYLSPTRAVHVRDQLGDKVDIILDGGPSSVGVESTVLDICGEYPRILRPGGTPREKIEALIGSVDAAEDSAADGQKVTADGQKAAAASPGMLPSHYAPRAHLALVSREEIIALPEISGGEGEAFLFFDGTARDAWQAGKHSIHAIIKTLSDGGNLLEAAANLFEYLHELDNSGVTRIYAQRAPDIGLGVAINDRLERAGYKVKGIK